MNNRILRILAVAVIAMALTLNVAAQPQMEQLLQNPEFIKMLELTSQQVMGLQKFARELTTLGETLRELRAQAQTDEEVRQIDMDVRRRAATWTDEWQTKIDEILKPEQRNRYCETAFQLSGGLSAARLGQNEWSLGFLDLTDVQKEQIRKFAKERDAKMEALTNEPVSLPPSDVLQRRRMATAEIRREYFEQIKSLLTAEQRAKAEKLTAEAPTLREKLGLPPVPQPRGGGEQ